MASVRKNLARTGNGNHTRHYSIGRWIDFARGLESPEEIARMAAHAESCDKCHQSMAFCVKLTAVAHCAFSTQTRSSSGGA